MATILVVDDEPDIRQLVQLNLELDGHDVVTAANGDEALDACSTASVPDVMLLDVMMPERRRLGRARSDQGRPATSTSTGSRCSCSPRYDTADDRVRGGIEGAIRYLTKPFSPDDAARRGPRRARGRSRAGASGAGRSRRRSSSWPGSRRAPTRRRRRRPPGPRLTRLEHRAGADARAASSSPTPASKLAELTDKQRELLERLATAPSVSDAADRARREPVERLRQPAPHRPQARRRARCPSCSRSCATGRLARPSALTRRIAPRPLHVPARRARR